MVPMGLFAQQCPGLCWDCSNYEIYCDQICAPDMGEVNGCYESSVTGCAVINGQALCICTRVGDYERDFDGPTYETE